MIEKIYVVIAAAGHGERLGMHCDKALVEIGRKSLLRWVLEAFNEIKYEIGQINIVIPEKTDINLFNAISNNLSLKKNIKLIYGADRRQLSVYKGILELNCSSDDIILVHDAARPFIRKELIEHIVDNIVGQDAVIPVIPVSDTIKVLGDEYVIRTLHRDRMGLVQTPQAFRLSLYKKVLERINIEDNIFTDEASLFEEIGAKIKYVEGDRFNFKITYREDLLIAQAIANKFIR